MTNNSHRPTIDLYTLFNKAFEHFNAQLFSNELPSVIITLQRQSNMMGYFSKNRWSNKAGNKIHEIAVNPSYFAGHKLIEIFQTVVHEQAHLWQEEFGTPSRAAYHNTEWANKMESIGLMPSNTGRPGGRRTGQRMSDYPIIGGQFMAASKALMEDGFNLEWIDRYPAYIPSEQAIKNLNSDISTHHLDDTTAIESALEDALMDMVDEDIHVDVDDKINEQLNTLVVDIIPDIVSPHSDEAREAKKNNKTKYQCECKNNVWGKPNLNIRCEVCDTLFLIIE